MSLALAAPLALASAKATPPVSPAIAPGSRQIDFVSTVTHRPYRLLIAVPASPPPPEGYPVIYLLDGNLFFGTAVDTVRLQGLNFIRPAVVVGVGYQTDDLAKLLTVRNKDLTSPPSDRDLADPFLTAMAGSASRADYGEQDLFLSMIQTEVKPMVEAATPIDHSRQALFGHSLGGLTTLRAMFSRTADYSAYIASSPSIWWADRAVLKEEAAFIARHSSAAARPVSVFLTVGDQEGSPPRTLQPFTLPEDRSTALLAHAAMIGNVEALGSRLQAVPGLRVRAAVFKDEDHASAPQTALAQGLRFVFGPDAR